MNNSVKEEARRIKGRHKAKMLTDLESIGNIKELDKTVISQHLTNFASDLRKLYEQEDNDDRGNRV